MSSSRVTIDNLANAVNQALQEYNDISTEAVKRVAKETADSVKNDIKQNAPKDTGGYSRSWAVKKQKETAKSVSYVVHSKDRYQLTHLLEFGHGLRGGGYVSPRPHIAQAEQAGIEEFEEGIRRALEE